MSVWKDIRSLWPRSKASPGIKVVNRKKVSLLMDGWIGHRPLKVLFPYLFTFSSKAASALVENRVNEFGIPTSEETSEEISMIGR